MDREQRRAVVSPTEDAVDRILSGGAAVAAATATPATARQRDFEFDDVFDEGTEQKEVYRAVGAPVLRDVLGGYNGSILAYGQTGSGKTHSLLAAGGGPDGGRQAGLLPRLVASLFVAIGGDTAHVYAVEAAMLQIYNEQARTVLRAGPCAAQSAFPDRPPRRRGGAAD